MTPPNPLIELAERCERLTGRDRGVADEVLLACGWTSHEMGEGDNRTTIWTAPRGEEFADGDQPDPTGSLDAAMTLRLDWMSIETCESAAPASSPELKFTRCRIWDWRRGPLAIDPTNETKAEGNRPLPLNICAAILRARAASESPHD